MDKKKLEDIVDKKGYAIMLSRPVVNDYIPTDALNDHPQLSKDLDEWIATDFAGKEVFYRDRNFAIVEDKMLLVVPSENFSKFFELKVNPVMVKVWQYKSKITSEPWITMKKAPTQEELDEYKKYRYELRQIDVEKTPDLEGYENI